jgi:serine/threonine protein kinase
MHANYSNYEFRGQGYNGIVLLAKQNVPSRRVAIKLSKRWALSDARLQDGEVSKIVGLDHPNIPTIFSIEYFTDLVSGRNCKAIVMKCVDGYSLSEISPDAFSSHKYDGARLFWSFSAVLEYCHCIRKFHGDLVSGGNIIVDSSSEAHLIDFAYSRDLTDNTVKLFDLERADLAALVVVANKAFGLTLDLSIGASDTIISIMKKIEKALGTEEARHANARNFASRVKLIDSAPKNPLYRIFKEHAQVTVFRDGSAKYHVVTDLEPLLGPLTHIRQTLFYDVPTTADELKIAAHAKIEQNVRKIDVELERQEVSQDDCIFHFTFRFEDPSEKRQTVVLDYQHPRSMNPSKDSWSQDFYTLCHEFVLSLTFSGCPMPTHWEAQLQLYGEPPKAFADKSWLTLDPKNNTAHCRFIDLRQHQSIHIQYR